MSEPTPKTAIELPPIAYPARTVEVDTAAHVASWGGEHMYWSRRQIAKLTSPPDAIAWLKGLPRESLWTMWGELSLTDNWYEWRWGGEAYALAHLLRKIPPRLEPYVITRTRWLIAYIERELEHWPNDSDREYKQEKLARLKQQLDDTGLATQEYQILDDEDPIPPSPVSE